MLFNSVWTIFPALPFLFYSHRILPERPSSKLIHLAVDAVTMLFWFAGFIALAAWYNNIIICVGKGCGVTVAVIVFGVLEWYVLPPSLSRYTYLHPLFERDLRRYGWIEC